MYKIIGADQKEYGPVTDDRLRQWIRQNRANALTLVKPEDSDEWRPLGTVAEFAGELAPFDTQPVAVEKDDTVDEAVVPMEGEPVSDSKLNIRQCLRRGIQLLLSRPGLLFGCTAVAGILLWLTGLPKNVGLFINVIISGPLYGGLFYVFLRVLRGQSTGFQDLFIGFREFFAPLMLAQVTIGLLTFLSSFFAFVFSFLTVLAFKSILFFPLALLAVIGMIPPIYLSVCWFFTLLIVVDKRMDYWPAMQLSRNRVRPQWILLAGLIFIAGMMGVSGTLFHQNGMILTLPIFLAVVVCAYEDLFKSSLDRRA